MAKVALSKYVNEQNKRRALFKQPPYDANNLSYSDLVALRNSVENELSPENLSQDGEASKAHIQRRGDFLYQVLNELN